MESWEERAKACLASKPRLSLSEVERLIKDGDAISEALPTLQTLKEVAKKAKEWLAKSGELSRHPEHKPYMETLETLVTRGRPLPVKLEALNNLETQVASGRAWREKTVRIFLKTNSNLALLDILCPRVDIGGQDSGKRKKKKPDETSTNSIAHPIFANMTQKELLDRKAIVKAFKDAEIRELQVTFKEKSAKKK